MVAFTLFALLMMLIAGGVAIDVMRQEMNRARMQNTLDSAVLAAAGAPYGTSPKAIVQDYMAKAGMSDYLGHIDDDGENGDDDIVQTLNSSRVSATAHMWIDTYLMHMSGVKQLGASAASSAERRVPKLEVAMVLDVSGSMGSNRKLRNLKTAGKKFVTTILNSSTPGDAVISIVPFSWDVTPGPAIFNTLNVDVRQDHSSCLQFTDDDFDASGIDPQVEQRQLIFTSEDDSGFNALKSNYRTCYTEEYAQIMPYSISETGLHAKLDALEASGNTSGNMGMKWGAAMVDPKFQSVKNELANLVVGQKPVLDAEGTAVLDAEGTVITEPIYMVDPLVQVVPAAYDEGETLKVIVMMGDGQNTYSNQFKLPSAFRGPGSYLHNVTWTQQEFQYGYHSRFNSYTTNDESNCGKSTWMGEWICVYEEGGGVQSAYYLKNPTKNEYLNVEEDTIISSWEFDNLENDLDGFLKSEQLSWEMAWGKMSPDFLKKEFNYWNARNEFRNNSNRVDGGEKDTQMDKICTAIKNKGVMVYTIGFEIDAGSTAETELKDCASSPEHYFPTNGEGITDAFSSIASNVVNLRLTQ